MPIDRTECINISSNMAKSIFQSTPKMSSYQVAFFISDFKNIEVDTCSGVKVRKFWLYFCSRMCQSVSSYSAFNRQPKSFNTFFWIRLHFKQWQQSKYENKYYSCWYWSWYTANHMLGVVFSFYLCVNYFADVSNTEILKY